MTTTERLCELLHERHAKGLEKYGTTLDRDDLTLGEWAQHAIEEMLDGAGYLMRLKYKLSEMRNEIETLRAENQELRNIIAHDRET